METPTPPSDGLSTAERALANKLTGLALPGSCQSGQGSSPSHLYLLCRSIDSAGLQPELEVDRFSSSSALNKAFGTITNGCHDAYNGTWQRPGGGTVGRYVCGDNGVAHINDGRYYLAWTYDKTHTQLVVWHTSLAPLYKWWDARYNAALER